MKVGKVPQGGSQKKILVPKKNIKLLSNVMLGQSKKAKPLTSTASLEESKEKIRIDRSNNSNKQDNSTEKILWHKRSVIHQSAGKIEEDKVSEQITSLPLGRDNFLNSELKKNIEGETNLTFGMIQN